MALDTRSPRAPDGGDDLPILFATTAIQKYRRGEPLSLRSLTSANFGRYLPLIEDMARIFAEAVAQQERPEGVAEAMQAYWTAVRQDPMYAALVAAVDAADVAALGRLAEPSQSNGDNQSDERPAVRRSQASLLVELAEDAEFFHTPGDDAYTTIPVNTHRETWPLKARAVRGWLRRRYYQRYKNTPSSQALQDALGVLEGKALYDGSEHPVFLRLAELDGAIYLDLGNDTWEAVEITAAGWRIVTDPPVKFRRARGLLPLPFPTSGGSIEELRPFVNVAGDEDWVLLKAFLVQALRPRGPYPPVILHGEQGSAKTTTSRMLRELIDPNTAALRAEPRDGRDLIIAATNGWVIALDNLSRLPPWLSDAICRLATGSGFATRELFTDNDEVLFDAQRPVILNGIEELATRGDLLDRAIIVYLPAIPEDQRRPESELWRDFEQKRPSMLGALLDAVSEGLRRIPAVNLERLPRMADFALWAVAAASTLGYDAEAFLRAYRRNRKAANELTLEASLITPLIRQMAAQAFSGTATELLQRVNGLAPEALKRQKHWPTNGRALSNALRRITPNLRAVGVEVTFHRAGKPGTRTISLSHTLPKDGADNGGKTSSAASAASVIDGDTSKSKALPGNTRSLADAQSGLADVRLTQAGALKSIGKIEETDAADAADAKILPQSGELEEGQL